MFTIHRAAPALEPESPAPATTTRRTLLGAGLGALVATVATALGRPPAASAANGDPLVLGLANASSSTTVWLSSEPTNAALSLVNTSTGNAYHGGSVGNAAFVGISQAGNGFDGSSKSANGVRGVSDSGIGVQGRSNTEKGVYGYSNSGPAVYGYSGTNHALWGYANGGNGFGTFGQSNDDGGVGAVGQNLITDTIGLLGAPKYGVEGRAPNAIGYVGVRAQAPEAAIALSVEGTARFSRSGKATVPAGRSFVVVDVPGGLSAASLVLATPQVNRPGVYVQSAVPNATTGQVRINLNKVASTSASTPIAWMVLS
jgi:hypothetical protein